MKLTQRPFLGWLRGQPALTLQVVDEGVAVEGQPGLLLSFMNMTAAPTVTRGWISSTITLPKETGAPLALRHRDRAQAAAFKAATEAGWRAFHQRHVDAEAVRIDRLLQELKRLDTPSVYPSACTCQPVLSDAQDLDERLLRRLPADAVGGAAVERLAPIRAFAHQPQPVRAKAIDRFVAAELERWREFFDTVESNPLTSEQRLSIVVDEDATLVLAGAGSGKTSVITAKAAYLLKAGIRPADQILLLAFAKDAATEMSERIQARCEVPIQARTFHALAYDIIGVVEGSKPALAAHATDDAAFVALIRDILKDLVAGAADIAHAIIAWFSQFLIDPPEEQDTHSTHDGYTQVEKLDLRTLQGEQVQSFEELQIANWLYTNGVAYEYEPLYEPSVSTGGKRAYTPDFRLTESGVYLEHFGVRRRRLPDGGEELTTAPHVNREEYLEGMEWKRQVHAAHGTTLIETFSYEQSEGRLLEALKDKVAPYVTLNPRPLDTIYDRVIELGHVDAFSMMLGTFLRQFKSGGYRPEDCIGKAERLKLGRRARAFMAVFGPVYREYQTRLGDRIDFEDMILRAARYVEDGRYVSPFRHILVDEFQDISQGRARLIKALKAQHADTRLFAVGDDWQSIYRFAGSDIHVMRNFGEEFGGRFGEETTVHRTVDLGRTFRSVDKIALAARRFVLQNPAQITKTVVPAGKAPEPAICIAWTRRGDEDAQLREVLRELAETAPRGDRKPTVLLLGRYRYVDPGAYDLQRDFPGLALHYKTIHASKGLEADHVILLRSDSGRMGFPSEITDDPLLSLVSPEAEPFENAEERRVMYVAMTRARFTLTILASEARPSAFVRELLNDPSYDVAKPVEQATDSHCACGQCGGRLLTASSQAGRLWYRCEHVRLCGNLLPACSSCGVGLPVKTDEIDACVCPSCTRTFTSCPACADGWLVPRQGKYGEFLSCVRYPGCAGKLPMPKKAAGASAAEVPRSRRRRRTP